MLNTILQAMPNLTEGGGFAAMIAGLGVVMGLVFLAVYIFTAIALLYIAKRTGTPNGWFGFIPILNVYLITQIGGVSGWWTLSVLLPIVPIIGYLAMLGVMIFLFWKVAEKCGKPGWWGIIITVVPIVNLVLLGILAWGKSTQQAKKPAK